MSWYSNVFLTIRRFSVETDPSPLNQHSIRTSITYIHSHVSTAHQPYQLHSCNTLEPILHKRRTFKSKESSHPRTNFSTKRISAKEITYSEIVCIIIVASSIPNPAPPNSSGNAIPIHPSLANAACNSCGYFPCSSCSAQYSYIIQTYKFLNSLLDLYTDLQYLTIWKLGFGYVVSLTSGKFEHIFAMASLTCNCVSEKPVVSISVFA